MGVPSIACMAQGFCYGKICVMELHVFPYQSNTNMIWSFFDAFDGFLPFCQIGSRYFQSQFSANDGRKIGFLQHQRCFIQYGQCSVFNDAIGSYITEHGNFLENGFFQRFIAAQYNNIWMNPHSLQFFYRMLSRFRFMFIRTTQERHQSYMDKQAIFLSYFQRNLSCRFQKWLGFDITNGTANFCNDNICIGLFPYLIDKFLDFICDMRNDLYGRAKVCPTSFFIQYIPINFPCGQIGIPIQIFINKAFIMS